MSLIFNPDGSKMSKRDKDKVLRAAVKERSIEDAPADSNGEPLVAADVWSTWRGDKSVQLDLDTLEQVAAALGVSLPEINVADFRRSGYLPDVLCNFLALNGWSAGDDLEKFDNAFLAERFDLDRVQKTPAKFDRDKLLAFNLDAIQGMSPDTFHDLARAHAAEFRPEFIERLDESQFRTLCDASLERSKTLDEPFSVNRFLVAADDEIEWVVTKPVRKAMFKGEPTGLELLAMVRPALAGLSEFDAASIEAVITAFVEEHAEGKSGSDRAASSRRGERGTDQPADLRHAGDSRSGGGPGADRSLSRSLVRERAGRLSGSSMSVNTGPWFRPPSWR